MFKMFAQLFVMFQVLFAAGEKGAIAVNHLGTWAEETAGQFADEARILRRAKMDDLLLEYNLSEIPKLEVAQAKPVRPTRAAKMVAVA